MTIKLLKLFAVFAPAYVLVGALLHQWVFPEPVPDHTNYPASGDEIVNCFAGERLVFLRTGLETGGSYSENEIHLQPGGAVPKAHVHLKQDETFHVLQGRLTLIVDGKQLVLEPGDSYTIRWVFRISPSMKARSRSSLAYASHRPAALT